MTAITVTSPPPSPGEASVIGWRHQARHGVILIRLGPLSTRVPARAVLVSLVLAVVLVTSLAWSISVGDFPMPIGDVVRELVGLGTNPANGFIIRTLRLPRVLTGALVGAAFGVSGQILQRLVRNPLASPDILGVTGGAAFLAVLSIVALSASTALITGSALVGAIGAMLLIYLLAAGKGTTGYRLILVGIGVTAMFDAAVAYLLTRAQIDDARRATIWLTGSLNGRGWEYVRPLTIALVLLVPVVILTCRHLRAIELGDEVATVLGVGVGRSRLVLGTLAAALAAVATAAAGPVAFVALASPQIARRLVGERTAGIVPAALVGAVLVVLSDLAARRLFAPVELPVGVVTGVIGAPYLLWLLARANRIGSGG